MMDEIDDLREELRCNLLTEDEAMKKYCCTGSALKCRASECIAWKKIATDIGPKGYCRFLPDPRLPLFHNDIFQVLQALRQELEDIKNSRSVATVDREVRQSSLFFVNL